MPLHSGHAPAECRTLPAGTRLTQLAQPATTSFRLVNRLALLFAISTFPVDEESAFIGTLQSATFTVFIAIPISVPLARRFLVKLPHFRTTL